MIRINNFEIRKVAEKGRIGYNVSEHYLQSNGDISIIEFVRFRSLKNAIRCALEFS